ncbi:MAG: dehydrogenase E1 component subunit alpha/beta [Acidimicrobiales bacterium]
MSGTDIPVRHQSINTAGFSDSELLDLYDELVLPRAIENRMLTLLRQGKQSKWVSGIGQEAVSVGVVHALREDDWVLPMHRNLGVWTTRDVDLDRLLLQLLGKAGGFTNGRDRTFHFGTLDDHIVGMISHLGATMPVADGLALAAQLDGTGQIAVSFAGDGGTSEGDFHEALNLAAVWKLPVVFAIENNGYGLSTPTDQQYACEHLVHRAVGYGMAGELVDGNDVCAVVEATRRAARRARSGEGPTLIEFVTFRMRGHEEASGTGYVPAELFETWSRLDPIDRLHRAIIDRGAADDDQLQQRSKAISAALEPRFDVALAAPEPSSTAERELADVHPPTSTRVEEQTNARIVDMRYLDAITDALDAAMEADPRVLLMGQDIAQYGGAFKATEGLFDRYGADRVRNTPIIESGAIGAGMGLALAGWRPVVEMQFGDFISVGFNQIVNNLATTYYRWGARVPMVIRAPIGGGIGAGPFHSQNIEGWFTHVAGLKVVAPATPADARDLLLAAIADDGPVLFLEHKRLYRSQTGPVDVASTGTDLGRARVARPGQDVTVVTYGGMVGQCLDTADALAAEGVEVEVIDLRSLVPWDQDTVLGSVRRTGRCLVVHEAPTTGGFGGEVAAVVADRAFYDLDAPVRRLGALDTPIPFAKALEQVHSPATRVRQALIELVQA